MTKLISKCFDCNQTNKKKEEEDEIIDILMNFVPVELAIMILKRKYDYIQCNICKKIVCSDHIMKSYDVLGNFGVVDVYTCSICQDYVNII